MSVPPLLFDAFERCYRAFATVPAPKKLDVSPYKDAEIGRRVLAKPLRTLSDDDIGPYAASSTLTVLGDDDYRHFIPRILELSVSSGGWPGADSPIIFNHLNRAGWLNWTPGQQAAVQEFFSEAFDWSINAGIQEPADAELWLCGNILMKRPLDDMLDTWRSSATPEAACRLADFRSGWIEANDARERLPYWDDVSEELWREIGCWLLDPATAHQLEAALDTVDEHDRWKLKCGSSAIGNRPTH